MRILIIMDPGILVPPVGYGGHERLVFMMAKEYIKNGHNVDLLVTKGSLVEGCQIYNLGVEGFPPKLITRYLAIFKAWFFLLFKGKKYDLIHNFGRLLFLIPVLNNNSRKIMTYGRTIDSSNINIVNLLPNKNLIFTAPSNWCVSTGNTKGNWRTIYNCIEFEKYDLTNEVSTDAPMIFLSRMDKLKGAIDAINIAKKLKKKLILAGNISNLKDEQEYFNQVLKPEIDNVNIIYVGALNDKQKNYYLGLASVFLFPARTLEAFGMVMIESMACGTPVIAYNHSAMPEVVKNGVSGFIVENTIEMTEKVEEALSLDRNLVRQFAKEYFDSPKVALEYLNLE